jgi:dTDP-4-amino-4,6-dideoxygalactose transaminase
MLYTELTEVGYKMNYTDLQASLGRVQLRRQPEFESRRSQIADVYGERLPSLLPGVRFQKGVRSPEHARHLFLILLPLESMSLTRDELLVGLRHRNIGATIHYAPLHRMPLYRERGTDRLPVTESVAERILSLPLSASMTLADAEYVLLHLQELAS